MFRTSVEDEEFYRYKDARITCSFDRTKYNFNFYFFAQHYFAYMRRNKTETEHPDDPRVSFFNNFFSKIGNLKLH